MPALVLAGAADSISANSRLKRLGARTQPCFTPFATGNGSDTSLFSMTLAIIPSYRDCTMLMNLGGQPSFDGMDQRPGLRTVSKALLRSTNKRYRSWRCSRHFSCSWRATNIVSTVPLFCLNPHWLSETTLSRRYLMTLFRRTRARSLPAMLRSEMPLWLSGVAFSPLFLYR